MGTRADFYIGRGEQAEWLGSIAWDGYPEGIELTTAKKNSEPFPAGKHLFDATTVDEFRARLAQYFANRNDVTLPEMGWPWPWKDSNTTDYAYAFDDGRVWANNFGHGWWPAAEGPEANQPDNKPTPFPDMTERTNLAMGTSRDSIVLLVARKP